MVCEGKILRDGQSLNVPSGTTLFCVGHKEWILARARLFQVQMQPAARPSSQLAYPRVRMRHQTFPSAASEVVATDPSVFFGAMRQQQEMEQQKIKKEKQKAKKARNLANKALRNVLLAGPAPENSEKFSRLVVRPKPGANIACTEASVAQAVRAYLPSDSTTCRRNLCAWNRKRSTTPMFFWCISWSR